MMDKESDMAKAISEDPGFFDRFIQPDANGPEVATSVSNDRQPQQEQTPMSEQQPADGGNLSPEARIALVSLLRQGVILADRKPQLFESIDRFKSKIQGSLADMYLRLSLDRKSGVAMVLQQEVSGDEDDQDQVSLISPRTLTLYDTLLLLVLRKHFQERDTAGEQRIIIDTDRIEASLTPFLPLSNNSKIDRRRLNGALTKMRDRRILSPVRGDDERYEITPVIRHVANAALLENMLEQYQELALKAGIVQEQAGQDGDNTHE